MESTVQQSENRPEEGRSPFHYSKNFAKVMLKDNKFWSRFGAIPNGVKLVVQAAIGAGLLLTAPFAVQIFGFAGCCILGAAGLCAIGYGFPGAWQRLEENFAQTFPRFNPLRRIGQPIRARLKKKPQPQQQEDTQKKRRRGLRLKESHMDIFLSGVTLEGSVFGIVVWPLLAVPVVLALPTLTVAGGLLLAGAAVQTASSIFGVVCSVRTLSQTARKNKGAKKGKETKAAPPQVEKAGALPAAATDAFNSKAVPGKQMELPLEEPAQPGRASGPRPLQ